MTLANENAIPSGSNYSLTVNDIATDLETLMASTPPAQTYTCTIQVYATGLTDDTEALRFTIDGSTDPTVSLGFLAGKSDMINLSNIKEIRNFKCIAAEVGVAITINVQFFKSN